MFDADNQIIKVKVINFTQEHFNNLGYDVKNGDIIFIPAKDLPDGSGIKIDVQCKYCGRIFKKSWRRYLETKENVCCKSCKEIKMMETSLEKYGDVCSLNNETVAEKRRETWNKKYGIGKNPLSSEDIREKAAATMLQRYGCSHKTINTSKQQVYLCNLYSGVINFRVRTYVVDAMLNNNIVFEYDGYGHDMSVRMGKITKEQFELNELNRQNFIISLGYKMFRISYMDKKDSLPSDKTLLCIIERAYIFFSNGYNLYKYDLKTRAESYGM